MAPMRRQTGPVLMLMPALTDEGETACGPSPLESSRHTRSAALSEDAYLPLFRFEVCCARCPTAQARRNPPSGWSGAATSAPSVQRSSVPRGPAAAPCPVRCSTRPGASRADGGQHRLSRNSGIRGIASYRDVPHARGRKGGHCTRLPGAKRFAPPLYCLSTP